MNYKIYVSYAFEKHFSSIKTLSIYKSIIVYLSISIYSFIHTLMLRVIKMNIGASIIQTYLNSNILH